MACVHVIPNSEGSWGRIDISAQAGLEKLLHRWILLLRFAMPRCELQVWDRHHRLRELARLKYIAYLENPFFAAAYPVHDQALMEGFLEKREVIISNTSPRQQIVVLVDTNLAGLFGEVGKVIAWMRVRSPEATNTVAGASEHGGSEHDVVASRNGTPLPPGCNLILQKHMRAQLALAEQENYNPATDYRIDTVLVDPAYRKQGLATQLLEWINASADSDGKRVYLASTPDGVPLYLQNGYEDVGGFATILPDRGDAEKVREYWIRYMVRYAKKVDEH